MNERNSMIVYIGDSHMLYECYGGHCRVNKDKAIPEFYSIKHAIDSGWTHITDRRYTPSGNAGGLICPDCSKELKGTLQPN